MSWSCWRAIIVLLRTTEMDCIAVRFRRGAWAVALCFVLVAAPSQAPAAISSAGPGEPASHEPAIEVVVQALWEAHGAAERAVETGDSEAIHEFEAEIDDGVHSLEERVNALPESRREHAYGLLDALFGAIDSLHEGADSGSARALHPTIVRLGLLIGQIEALFLEPGSEGAPAQQSSQQTPKRK